MIASRPINKRRMIAALGLVLGLSCPSVAQTTGSNSGPREGIKVHGHWVIDVRNPDGSLASHHEFENDLNSSLNSGPSALAAMLGRHASVGQWIIRLGGGFGPGDAAGPCSNPANPNSSSYCDIVEPTSPVTADSKTFKNLAVAVPMTTLFRTFEAGTIELSGLVTASSTTQVGHVMTVLGLCPASVLPAACAPTLAGDFRFFTGTFLATPVVAAVDQIIQVKVILSFS